MNDSTIYANATNGWNAISSPTRLWADGAARNLSTALAALDKAHPGRIAGVQLVGVSGEWMMPAMAAHTDPASGFVGDYTPQMQKEFCAAERRNDPHASMKCVLPSAIERNAPTLGNTMMQWNSSDDSAARAFRMNRFLSDSTASAISITSAAVKNTSAGAALTVAFYGYLFSLSDTRLTGSGHLSLGSVLNDKNLDMIASPWQYRDSARQRGGAMTVHGPIDSVNNHNQKIWAIEDDTYLFRSILMQSKDQLGTGILCSYDC